MNHNLYAALRAGFPRQLDATAIEVCDASGAPGFHTWHDLDRASAMLANLLASLHLPEGARVAVHTGKSVEEVEKDTDRDNFLSAESALKYGIIDKILESRHQL